MRQTGNTLNDVRLNDGKNVRITDEFLRSDFIVSQEEYDVVLSFFMKVMKSEEAAEAFTVSLFQVSRQVGAPVVELLKQLKNKDEIEMTAQIAYYMNGIRSAATLLGVTEIVEPNWYAARNVVS